MIKNKTTTTTTTTEPLPVAPRMTMKLFFKKLIRKYIVSILFILVLVLAAVSAYLYYQSRNDPSKVSAREVKTLTSTIGKLVLLPSDESPTIATVSDPDALSDQSFFVGAQKDDKVLIYSNAKKAILYRPSIDKIINIAPLNLGDSVSQKTPEPEQPKVAPVTTETPDKKQ